MADFKHLKVGDPTIFVKPRQRMADAIEDGVVTKVGRKYLTVEYGNRFKLTFEFERESGLEKRGDYTNYRAHLIESREAYEEAHRIEALWRAFHDAVRHLYYPKPGVTREKIATAAALLNVDLKLKKEEN